MSAKCCEIRFVGCPRADPSSEKTSSSEKRVAGDVRFLNENASEKSSLLKLDASAERTSADRGWLRLVVMPEKTWGCKVAFGRRDLDCLFDRPARLARPIRSIDKENIELVTKKSMRF